MKIPYLHIPKEYANSTVYVYSCSTQTIESACMYLLLTAAVKHYGGSSKLIKLLNRVGAIS